MTGTSTSVTGTVTAASVVGGVMTGTSTSVTGTVTAASVVGGVMTGTSVSVTGNVTGAYLFGNASQVTGLPAGYTNSNTATFLASFGSNSISTTGTVTAASVVGGVMTGTSTSVTGTVTAASVVGGVMTGTSVSVTGTITGGNLATGGTASAGGNVTGANFTTAGILTVNSGNGATAIVNGGTNGSGNIGASGAGFNTIFAKATTAQYADLAEMYAADAEYAPGTVVDFGGEHEVTVSDADMSRAVAGVVSTNPSYLMNSEQQGEHVVAVALTGRVPTRVTGAVRKGDLMVSNGDGTARSESAPAVGTVIGKALENFEGTTGVIEVVVGRF